MKYVPRALERTLAKAARAFPAVMVTGPRRAGKTTLLCRAFPHAQHCLLEDPDVVARVRADPRTFLDELRLPVILDEIQNAPELLNYIRTRIDSAPRRRGAWLLTGSQEAPLMQDVTESLAGRVAILQLLPLSSQESDKVSLFRGGFPEVLARPSAASLWFASYVQTYLERDVRAVTAVRDLATFRRFLSLTATRSGTIVNKTDLAAPMGVSVPTITQWLGILEVTGQIALVPPYFEHHGKRLIKSPKLYFLDSGLACHLLGIDNARQLERSTFLGPLFEGFVAAEIIKQQIHAGRRRELWHFRDQQGFEVDFLAPGKAGKTLLVEAKASRTVRPEAADKALRLRKAMEQVAAQCLVVHRGDAAAAATTALRPGARAVPVSGLLARLR